MERFNNLREELSERWGVLQARVACVEQDAADRGFACSPGPHPEHREQLPVNTSLERFLDDDRQEIGRLTSAIHRIDRKVFDCCILCGGTISPDRLSELPYSASCEACSRDYPTSYDEGLRIQHRGLQNSLLALLDATAEVKTALDRGSDARAEIAAAAVIFASLHREIPEHFAREEHGGYLSEALQHAPHLNSRAAGLQRQHASFVRGLDGIFSAILDAESRPALFSRVERNLREFAMRLIQHEDAENRLVQLAREQSGPHPSSTPSSFDASR